MKILFLSHRLPYAANRGDRVRAMHLIRELSRQHEVHLVSLVHSREEAAHAPDLGDITESVTVVRAPAASKYLHAGFGVVRGLPLTHALLATSAFNRRCCDVFEREHPDLVFCYCTGVAPATLRAPLNRVPLVLDMVDVDSVKWRDLSASTSPVRRWIYRREARRLADFERAVARAADTVLVVNDREQVLLNGLEPIANVRPVPNGVSLQELHPKDEPASAPRIVFCGVMNYQPNVDGVLWFARHAWPRVRAAYPDARFCIVGSDPVAEIRTLAAQDSGIEVTAAVPDVRPYLWQSAVSIAPLFVARGVQNKVLEAIAAGLPVVVTPMVSEGLPRQVRGACMIGDGEEAFAAAVVRLLATSPRRRRSIAGSADLSAIGWSDQLRPVLDIVARAAGASQVDARQALLTGAVAT